MSDAPADDPGAAEAARLAALERFRILDTPAEEMFDELTTIAAEVCGTPVALLTVLDDHRQWFKSRVGLDISETPRSLAFCHHTIQQAEPFVVPDAHADARFSGNDLVTGDLRIRFYAGAPVLGGDQPLGTICVIDREPRVLEPWQLTTLQALARHASTILDLRLREMEFREFIDASPDGMLLVDAAGRIRYANATVAAMATGTGPVDLIGRDVRDVCPDEAGAAVAAALEAALADGAARSHECGFAAADGREVPVELVVSPITISGEPMGKVTVRDITDRRRAERELAEQQRLIETMLDKAPAAVWVKDSEGRYVVANRIVARQAGRPGEDILGRTDADLYPPELAVRFAESDRAAVVQGVTVGEEPSLVDPGRVWSTLKFPIVLDDGTVIGVAGISTDVTEERSRAAQEELLRQRLEQRDRLESIGKLAGGVAHDFNNLLMVIMTSAQFAADALRDLAAQDAGAAGALSDLDDVTTAARRAATLIQQLLVFARREPAEPQEVDVNAAITGTTSLLRRTLGSGTTVALDLHEGLAPVRIDPTRLDQVLVNLAVNARDAMPAGGTIRIVTDEVPWEGDADAGVRIRVVDHGAGMAPEVAARALEPFFTTKEPGAGTGLGLATAYGIVSGAGGSLAIDSAEGRGTTVSVVLPAVRPAAGRADAHEAAGGARGILVVDDAAPNLRLVARVLERAGYEVRTAGGGAEALAVLGEHAGAIDLLLTDVLMPGMSGIELATAVRERHPDVRLLLMSGYFDAQAGDIPGPAVPLLPKPFGAADLLRQVEQALAGTGTAPA